MLIQFAVPGAMELLLLLLFAIVLFGIPVVLALVFGTMWLRSSGDDDVQEQLEALHTEMSQLRAELEDSEATVDATGDAPSDPPGSATGDPTGDEED